MPNPPINSRFPRGVSAKKFATGKGSVFGTKKTPFHIHASTHTFAAQNKQTFSVRHPAPFLPAVPRKGD